MNGRRRLLLDQVHAAFRAIARLVLHYFRVHRTIELADCDVRGRFVGGRDGRLGRGWVLLDQH